MSHKDIQSGIEKCQYISEMLVWRTGSFVCVGDVTLKKKMKWDMCLFGKKKIEDARFVEHLRLWQNVVVTYIFKST